MTTCCFFGYQVCTVCHISYQRGLTLSLFVLNVYFSVIYHSYSQAGSVLIVTSTGSSGRSVIILIFIEEVGLKHNTSVPRTFNCLVKSRVNALVTSLILESVSFCTSSQILPFVRKPFVLLDLPSLCRLLLYLGSNSESFQFT